MEYLQKERREDEGWSTVKKEVSMCDHCTCGDGLIWYGASSGSVIDGEECIDLIIRISNVPKRLLKYHSHERKHGDFNKTNRKNFISRAEMLQAQEKK